MIKPLILVGLVATPAAVGLGIWAGENQTPPPTVTAARQNAPLVAKPGRTAESAAKTFAQLDPPPPKVIAPPAPPPPDVALTLRRDVRALRPGAGNDGRLILTGARQLKLGDRYGDGWRLTAVTNQTATLRKGNQERKVDFFAPDPAMAQAALTASQAAPAVTQVSFTNGVRAGQLPPALLTQLLGMMRQSGVAEAQVEQMRKTLGAGSVTQSQLLPLLMGMARSGRVPPQQLTRFVESLSRAGFMPPEQVPSLSQNLRQVAQSRQTEAIMQQLNRPGGNAPGGRVGGRGGPQFLPPAPNPNGRVVTPLPSGETMVVGPNGRARVLAPSDTDD
jgi:hypothetical protein